MEKEREVFNLKERGTTGKEGEGKKREKYRGRESERKGEREE